MLFALFKGTQLRLIASSLVVATHRSCFHSIQSSLRHTFTKYLKSSSRFCTMAESNEPVVAQAGGEENSLTEANTKKSKKAAKKEAKMAKFEKKKEQQNFTNDVSWSDRLLNVFP